MKQINETQIPIGISNQYYQYFKLNKLKVVDVFAELIDNSISSCKKGNIKPLISINLFEDSIEITDNGIGFSELDFQSAFIAADSRVERIGNSEFSVYGYGLKGAAFWLGNILKINSISKTDKKNHSAICDLTKLPHDLSPMPTLTLRSIDAELSELYEPKTTLTISEINGINYSLGSTLIAELKECLAKVYYPMIIKNEISLYINSESITTKNRDYLMAFKYDCYKNNGSNNFTINKKCLENKELIEWKRYVNEQIIDESTKTVYSINGYIGLKPDQKEKDCGIRVYRKNRGILGCNSRINDFNPFNLQQGKPAYLFLIGDINISDSFEKPLMGNDLPNKIILQELLDQFRRKNTDLFQQAHEFRIKMLNASFNQTGNENSNENKKTEISNIKTNQIKNNTPEQIINNFNKPVNISHNRLLIIENGYNIEFAFQPNNTKTNFTLQTIDNTPTIKIICDHSIYQNHKILSKIISKIFEESSNSEFEIFINELNNVD